MKITPVFFGDLLLVYNEHNGNESPKICYL